MSGAINARGRDIVPPAFHNSGPVPQAVHYTTRIGRTFTLDLGALLIDWKELPAALRRPMRLGAVGIEGATVEHFAPPEKAAGIARFLLDAITPKQPTRAELETHARRIATAEAADSPHARACASIAALAECVAELGWLAPFHGLTQWGAVTSNERQHLRSKVEAETEFPWLPKRDEHRALYNAWCVCAVSYASPPLILWTRQPSLTWWRGDNAFALQWFGSSATSGGKQ